MKTNPFPRTTTALLRDAISTIRRRKLVPLRALAACLLLPATPVLAQLQTVVEFTGTSESSKGSSPEAVLASDGAGWRAMGRDFSGARLRLAARTTWGRYSR